MIKFNKINFFIYVVNTFFCCYCFFMFRYFTILSVIDIVLHSFLIICAIAYYFYLYLQDELTFKSFFIFIFSSFILVNILIGLSIVL